MCGGANANANSNGDRPDANALAYAILNGAKIPGHDIVNPKKRVGQVQSCQTQGQTHQKHHASGQGSIQGHIRRASAPADTVSGAIEKGQTGRMELGWKPTPKPKPSVPQLHTATQHATQPRHASEGKDAGASMKRASSADLALPSKFSPDTSPSSSNEPGERNLRAEIERELDKRLISHPNPQVRKSSSQSTIRHSNPNAVVQQAGEDTMAGSSQEVSQKEKAKERHGKRMTTTLDRNKFDEVKNKPLPRIAAL